MNNYQIFISYRREGGSDLAGRIADRFTSLGYSVFFDVESMRSGKFNEQLLSAIANSNDVLLILPPNALDRCANCDDWVRQEISFAIKTNKNIIPIMMRGFSFPEVLPPEIDQIRYMEGVTASSEYFDAVIDKIEKLLTSKKNLKTTTQKYHDSKQIKVPLFLKTPTSNFESVANKLIPHLRNGRDFWQLQLNNVKNMSQEDYIQQDIKLHEKLHEKYKPNGWTFMFNQKESEDKYNQHHDPDLYIQKTLEKYFNSLNVYDDSVISNIITMAFILRDSVNNLYLTKPCAYEIRVLELMFLCFELCPYELSKVFENIFQNDDSFVRSHWEKNYRDSYSLLSAVSYTIECETQLHRFDKNIDISLFILSFLALFTLACPEVEMRNKIKKYILINYKYIQKSGCNVPLEVENIIFSLIEMCEKS